MRRWLVQIDKRKPVKVLKGVHKYVGSPTQFSTPYFYVSAEDELDAWVKAMRYFGENK